MMLVREAGVRSQVERLAFNETSDTLSVRQAGKEEEKLVKSRQVFEFNDERITVLFWKFLFS